MNTTRSYRLALLASGEGTNAETIIRHFKDHPKISVVTVMSNQASAGVMARAAAQQVPCVVFDKKEFETGAVLEQLKNERITHIVLAGFLWLIPKIIIEAYPDKIINIHPALLPRFGGKGMFGRKVHEAVKAAGALESGITIHIVNEEFDKGKIIFQKKCSLLPNDSVDGIAKKVLALEHEYYPKVIEGWVLE